MSSLCDCSCFSYTRIVVTTLHDSLMIATAILSLSVGGLGSRLTDRGATSTLEYFADSLLRICLCQ